MIVCMSAIQYHSNSPSEWDSDLKYAFTNVFMYARYLQDAFDVPLVIMLTDDEKFLHSPKLSLKECRRFALENALDIIAIGFDPKKTFIFADTEFIYSDDGAAFGFNILEMSKKTTNNQIKGTFGFNDT